MKLSGYTCVRNAIELDYPVHLCIESMLSVCDEIVVCDSDSTDGTKHMLLDLADEHQKIRVINRPWKNPNNDAGWWTEWLNWTREHLQYPMQLQLDADEVLDTSTQCIATIRDSVADEVCRTFDRLNFWGSPRQLIPEGHCCGKYVVRLGPTKYWMPSDEPHHAGELAIIDEAKRHQDLRIFHLGFLRKEDAFFRKSKVVQRAFFGGYDERLTRAEEAKTPFWKEGCEFLDKLIPYIGGFPEPVIGWLKERGYEV